MSFNKFSLSSISAKVYLLIARTDLIAFFNSCNLELRYSLSPEIPLNTIYIFTFALYVWFLTSSDLKTNSIE